jgi:hypothetical protein
VHYTRGTLAKLGIDREDLERVLNFRRRVGDLAMWCLKLAGGSSASWSGSSFTSGRAYERLRLQGTFAKEKIKCEVHLQI